MTNNQFTKRKVHGGSRASSWRWAESRLWQTAVIDGTLRQITVYGAVAWRRVRSIKEPIIRPDLNP
jgi:hypothetical protein